MEITVRMTCSALTAVPSGHVINISPSVVLYVSGFYYKHIFLHSEKKK